MVFDFQCRIAPIFQLAIKWNGKGVKQTGKLEKRQPERSRHNGYRRNRTTRTSIKKIESVSFSSAAELV
jgi:uncharacterized protein with gpF-like domain